jgi:hypothetical protein
LDVCFYLISIAQNGFWLNEAAMPGVSCGLSAEMILTASGWSVGRIYETVFIFVKSLHRHLRGRA